jgi:hypothetical protein
MKFMVYRFYCLDSYLEIHQSIPILLDQHFDDL